jgi:hypothetical protein
MYLSCSYITGNQKTGDNSHIGHCTHNSESAGSHWLETICFEEIQTKDDFQKGRSKIQENNIYFIQNQLMHFLFNLLEPEFYI